MSKGPYYSEGDYMFAVEEQGFGESKNGTPFFFFRGRPVSVVLADGSGSPLDKQYPREIKRYLSEKAVEYTIADLRRLGWQGESFRELDPSVGGHLSWVGQTIQAVCTHDVNDAGTWEQWGLPYVAGDKPEKAKSDVKIASKLDAMFGKLAKESATKKSQPAKRQPVASSTNGGEDIPF